MNTPSIFWLVPAASLVALAVAWIFYSRMKREDEGTERMREIAAHVRKGAMAYLRQQYKVVLVVFLVLALFFAYLAYGAGVQNPWVPFAFLTGGFFSGLAGFFGMKTATYASARTANAARQSLDRGLKVAFRSGAALGRGRRIRGGVAGAGGQGQHHQRAQHQSNQLLHCRSSSMIFPMSCKSMQRMLQGVPAPSRTISCTCLRRLSPFS